MYVQHLVQVFREVRRVLRKDGTLWLNLGDSYASDWPCRRRNIIGQGSLENSKREARPPRLGDGLKSKDLCGIPWRVAFALQADGWYLRSDIIWHKPNPMPESVTDRPTKAHEYIFLMSKAPKYFWDQDAVREASKPESLERYKYDYGSPRQLSRSMNETVPKGDRSYLPSGRNIRSVWTIPTAPFKGAHFATFPERLVEPMVKAGCPVGGLVLDPFIGSGTVGVVAKKLARHFLGIELSAEYVRMANERLRPYLCQAVLA